MLILFRADNGNEAADNLTLVIYLSDSLDILTHL